MAIQKFTVEVVRTDEYEITIDDSIYTEDYLEQWSESFFETEEGNRQEDFAKHIALGISLAGKAQSLEGFGFVKQAFKPVDENDIEPQYGYNRKQITEQEYTPGIQVKILEYNDGHEVEIFETQKV
ncbi:hypothetical protein [Flavobacterium sp. 14A]|uniref:hypothetical protein n=1 Tax=Flavobacterium sp. 14A TaxID=2735896 RepID=UPI00156E695B|nr:hypothetical protein [Flavobacterium sp. 14A]NRT11508.1 hypothetical protein [Flavobacterium sp. 14A]